MNLENFDLLSKITSTVPALITVYNIKTGKYIFVNDAIKTLLGYNKNKFLNEGLAFATSIVHPDDLQIINVQNAKALKLANSKTGKLPASVSFEYRMRHKNGSWRWLHSDGAVFSRDKNGMVECVMNVSMDITESKSREIKEKLIREQAEFTRNKYHKFQLRSVNLRAQIADVLRKELPIIQIIKESLEAIVENLPATFSRLWLLKHEQNVLELMASGGDYPPTDTIRKTLNIGEYAVGLVAERNKPYITNDIYQNNFFHIQNIKWSKSRNLISFAGYPLFVKNQLVGVLAVFADYELQEDTLDILANVADVLAQEIEGRRIEAQLNESQERYLSFIKQSSEGIWRFELEEPMPVKLRIEKQIDHFYKYACLEECNDALAKMYGYKKATDIIGARLGDMLIRDNPQNISYLKEFINAGYTLSGTDSTEVDRFGHIRHFQNSLIGIVENGYLVRAWGIQQDVTERKKAEQEIIKLSRQKDEFIAIASHELKTPVTSLKAYTQILERRLKVTGDESSAEMLNKMDLQINKLTTLIADLLDVSKIEAGKLQFHISNFNLTTLLKETIEEMQRTSGSHKLIFKYKENINIKADRDRISQVVINFLSNAIKYSPDANKIMINVSQTENRVRVTVRDFGIGINENEQKLVFERFFRANIPQKESYPGLGLGLYICAEIIRRHGGKIGVRRNKGRGSSFYFTLPVSGG